MAATGSLGRLAGQILARRMRLPRPLTRDVEHQRDLRVTMDDGVVLLADRWVPRGADGARPTVLVRSPYGRGGLVGLLFGRLLAERGLQCLVQSVRGGFGSGGQFNPFDERDDGLATVRWLRAQPWHGDRVATIGPSYLGFVQWAIAAELGDELAAMCIHVSASQFYGQTYGAGAIALENLGSWMTVLAAQESRLGPLAIGRALRRLPAAMDALPLSQLDLRATGAQVDWFQSALGYPSHDDPYWVARDHAGTVSEVRAPVQFVGGWYDILLPWMLADFEALRAAGHAPQLTIGPWAHTSPGLLAAAQRESVGWLRAHLLDDRRLVRDAPVALALTGADGARWREFHSWPPPGSAPRRLHLRADGALTDAPPDDGSPGCDRYLYDPADPTPALGGPVLLTREPVLDNAPLEARPDVLTYTGAALERDLTAIGNVSVELWLRATPPHFDVFARVCDVDAAGVSRNVCDALTSVGPDRCERGADGSFRVRFDLWPLAHRFAAGHRIRLQVSSGAHPRYARNPGTGSDPLAAIAESMVAVELELLRDAEHPSALVMPVLA